MQSKFMKRTTLGAVVGVAVLAAGMAQAAGVPGQGTWETTLQPRDLDGNAGNGAEAFYDTALDITWLRDANAGAGSAYDNGFSNTDGLMTWANAVAWATNLNVYGITGWRLPTVSPVNATSFQYGISNNGSTDVGTAKTNVGWGMASELGHLYYVTLGNLGGCTPNDAAPGSCVMQTGWGLSNTGGFQNPQSDVYWSGTEFAAFPEDAWYFDTSGGVQSAGYQYFGWYAMAVRPGDVAAVPEPQAFAMLLLGLSVVMVAVRRRPR